MSGIELARLPLHCQAVAGCLRQVRPRFLPPALAPRGPADTLDRRNSLPLAPRRAQSPLSTAPTRAASSWASRPHPPRRPRSISHLQFIHFAGCSRSVLSTKSPDRPQARLAAVPSRGETSSRPFSRTSTIPDVAVVRMRRRPERRGIAAARADRHRHRALTIPPIPSLTSFIEGTVAPPPGRTPPTINAAREVDEFEMRTTPWTVWRPWTRQRRAATAVS